VRGFVLAGTNVSGEVSVLVSGAASVTLSNLCLAATNEVAAESVFRVDSDTALHLAGTSTLRSGDGLAGLRVAQSAALTLDGETLEAFGGEGGAGILGGSVTINGGLILPVGGEDAVGIGGELTIRGGTVFAHGGGLAPDLGAKDGDPASTVVLGGSVHAVMGRTSPAVSNASERVYCVTVPDCAPNSPVALVGLEWYGMDGILSDADGKVYLWLPSGVHFFAVDGVSYVADVDGRSAVAERYVPTGVHVDGTDVSRRRGDGWQFAQGTLSFSGNCTVSGTNSQGMVAIMVEPTVETLTLSNLVLRGTQEYYVPISVFATNRCAVVLAGANELEAGANAAALAVGDGFSVEVSGRGTLKAIGGDGGAGIGGGWRENGSYVSIYGGVVEARGGMNGAGIGGGWRGKGGNLSVYGGRVTAVGGAYASAIGGGYYETGVRYFQNGGTVIANGGSVNLVTADAVSSSGRGNVIRGGSLHVTGANPTISTSPVNGSNVRVWCVAVTNLVPGAKVALNGLSDYGTSDIFADDTGAVYLWLPDGAHLFSTQIGEETWRWRADVSGADTVAVAVTGPDGLSITDIVLAETTVDITVAADPTGWMASGYASLRVRAGAALPLSAGDEALLDPSQVTTTLNADGTATLSVPRQAATQMFYRIETAGD